MASQYLRPRDDLPTLAPTTENLSQWQAGSSIGEDLGFDDYDPADYLISDSDSEKTDTRQHTLTKHLSEGLGTITNKHSLFQETTQDHIGPQRLLSPAGDFRSDTCVITPQDVASAPEIELQPEPQTGQHPADQTLQQQRVSDNEPYLRQQQAGARQVNTNRVPFPLHANVGPSLVGIQSPGMLPLQQHFTAVTSTISAGHLIDQVGQSFSQMLQGGDCREEQHRHQHSNQQQQNMSSLSQPQMPGLQIDMQQAYATQQWSPLEQRWQDNVAPTPALQATSTVPCKGLFAYDWKSGRGCEQASALLAALKEMNGIEPNRKMNDGKCTEIARSYCLMFRPNQRDPQVHEDVAFYGRMQFSNIAFSSL